MATRQLDVLNTKGTHAVGNINSKQVKTLANGAKCKEAIDNFTIVELLVEDGERKCQQLTVKTNKGYLIASVEMRTMGEELVDFYNGENEMARVVVFEPGYTRFDVSAFTKNAGLTEVVVGNVAHFDVATKKFIISEVGSEHADYGTSANQFLVVASEEDLDYTLGAPLVRLEVIK